MRPSPSLTSAPLPPSVLAPSPPTHLRVRQLLLPQLLLLLPPAALGRPLPLRGPSLPASPCMRGVFAV